MNGLWKPKVASVLGDASIACLAVETSSGPHVTPLLFGATPDRLWFGIGRRTLKARVLAKRPAVGVVVPGAGASVAIRGEATLLDRLPASPAELARAPFALPAFAARSALEAAAFARDVARRGAQPRPLVPLSVRIETLDLLVAGRRSQFSAGWRRAGRSPCPRGGTLGPSGRASRRLRSGTPAARAPRPPVSASTRAREAGRSPSGAGCCGGGAKRRCAASSPRSRSSASALPAGRAFRHRPRRPRALEGADD